MHKISIVLIGLLVSVSSWSAPAAADPDPEIGQPIVAERHRIKQLDTTGSNSAVTACTEGDKHFLVVARIKWGTPGRFVQVRSSWARIKLTSGEVIRSRGLADDAKRRLVFVLSPSLPSGDAEIKRSARRYLVAAVNNPSAEVKIGPLRKMCLVHESA